MKYANGFRRVQFDREWADMFYGLSDADAGQLIKAIFADLDGKTVTIDNPVVQGIFVSLAMQIDTRAFRALKRTGALDDSN